MLMELAKKGTFKLVAAAQSNPGRCGSAQNRDYTYELKIALPSANLDKDDFVFDHLVIQRYFDQTFGQEPWILSCELMAARVVVDFYNALQSRNVQSIEINIVADNVNHRAVWRREQEARPPIPPIRSSFANVANNWYAGAIEGKIPAVLTA